MRLAPFALLTAAALAAPALAAAAEPAAPSRERSPLGYDVRLRAWAGAFDGFGVLDLSGSFTAVEAALTPELRTGKVAVALPFRAEHVERPGNDLSETRVSAGMEPEVRVSRTVSVGADGGVTWLNRPGWPDVYQRQPDGSLLGTDRYGYFSWRAGGSVWLRPGGRRHLRAHYRYAHFSYADEPAFDPVDPAHLTPRDRGEHGLDLSWRTNRDRWSATVALDSSYRLDESAQARDALSGSPDGNPLQRLLRTEPSFDVEWKQLGGRVDLDLSYGLGLQSDRFQGYYSYQEHHPRAVARVSLAPRLDGRLELEGRFRRYGADSTRSSRLESGGRRTDTRLGARAGLALALGGGFALRGEASWLNRETNFPDYHPDLTPPDYDIDWDFRELSAALGLEWRASRDAGR